MKTYGETCSFLESCGIDCIELHDEENIAKVLLVPGWQARVMTSTASGDDGVGFGWVNRRLIESGEVKPQFNPYGGEERFWLGPEGGAFSLYFAPGAEQVYENWQVPAALDTKPFWTVEKSDTHARFVAGMLLRNASGTQFNTGVEREVSLLSREEIETSLGTALPKGVSAVAYRSANRIENRGENEWTRQSGAPSVWMLGMFAPTPATTLFLPYDTTAGEPKVNSAYFGEIPAGRLSISDALACLRIDGRHRSKIGLPKGFDTGICGSYDAAANTLTLVKYRRSQPADCYVDSRWGAQEDPFAGDVINAYNDGPTETGEVMGPFYEIETSSPAALLRPGESLTHVQEVFHFQGDEPAIAAIMEAVVGAGSLDVVKNAF